VHLDIGVRDLDRAEDLALSRGATKLDEFEDHRVLADAVGHPFCLYPDRRGRQGDEHSAPGRIERVVFDCFSPRALASFYEELLDMRSRVVDTPHRVVLAGDDGGVMLAFQHSAHQPPRWPDPAHPAQLHLDLAFADPSVREHGERLGAMHLPLPERPDNLVYADPAGHPFCLGLDGRGTYGPAQVDEWSAAGG
jgi:Glyoxalase-like domain